ncbi:MAG TPA: glycerophosphodiester phosphodiesterase family protein [Steroidobacteraceae bacterium]
MTRHDSGLPPLIAHRGNAADFPENTLQALQSAVDLGLRHVEFDVQLTRDAVPVVLHDSDLRRVANRPECVHDLTSAELAEVPVTESARFGDRFTDVRAPTLARVVDAILQWQDVTAFVEVKRASLRRFGREAVLQRIAAVVAPALQHCVLISFDLPSLGLLRSMPGARIGWVIEQYDEPTRQLVHELAPDHVFVDLERVPHTTATLWPGPWRWALYEIRDLASARRCADLGAHGIETMHVRAMLGAYAAAGQS